MIRIKKSYIVLVVITFIFALFSGGNLPYSIFYCVVLVLLISGVYTYIVKKGIYVDIGTDKKIIQVGEENGIIIKVYNDSIFPIPYIEVQNSLFRKFVKMYRGDFISISISSNKFLKKSLSILVRGQYNLGESSCVVSDIFGIFTWEETFVHKEIIKVYPKVYQLSNITINGANLKEYNITTIKEVNRGHESLETIKNIREYRVGDSYKRINWKVTAKHGKLFIKEYESSESPRIHVFLDLRSNPFSHDENGQIEEDVVEFFLSLINHIKDKNTNSQAVIVGATTRSFHIGNNSQFEMLREQMVTSYSGGKGSLSKFMKNSIYEIAKRSAMVIVSCDISKENVDYFISLADKGYTVTLFYLNRIPGLNEESISKISEHGISCYNIEGLR
ncbi:MAG: DUF58 domain-containing protein [Clostridium sp.]|uniref:DUF58 domain-containing protein n=1 Tax=Clostridium sp. TaxID=1506 RepID=UPI00306FD133